MIVTERLWMRPLCVADAEFVLRLTKEPAFIENIGDKRLRHKKDAETFLTRGVWTNQPIPGYGQFLVLRKEGDIPVGVCGLLYREMLHITDVGFAFHSDYWGHGYASEAAKAVLLYGQQQLGIEEIFGLTGRENLRSIRVLESLGMRFLREVFLGFQEAVLLYGYPKEPTSL